MFLIKSDVDILEECGFVKSEINRLFKELKIFLKEQNKEYFEYIENEKESIIETILKDRFYTHKRLLNILLSFTDPHFF